jgi:gamma-glutamylcyclotransferase (GGCT)/AIG2-like uncharacterized protein YtfP
MRAQEFNYRNDPAPVYYFAYGMLTDPKNMPGCQAIGAARLHNHRLEFYQYADVEQHAGTEVRGVLWSLPMGMLSQLDQVEGVPYLYNRKTMPVTAGGQRYEAYVYTMTPQARQQVKNRAPSTSYLRTLARGYIKFDLPNSQLHSAIQRAMNPESELAEVAMNPGAFAASAQQASDRGVLVGYEFEVLVPKASITAWQNSQQTTEPAEPNLGELLGDRTVADVVKLIANDTWAGLRSTLERLEMFKASDGTIPIVEYVKSVKDGLGESRKFVKKIKKELERLDVDARFSARRSQVLKLKNKFIREFKNHTGYDLTLDNGVYPDNFTNLAKNVCHRFYYDTPDEFDEPFYDIKSWAERNLDQLPDITQTSPAKKFSKWVKNTYGTDNVRDLLASRTWKLAKVDNRYKNAAQARRALISHLDPTYVNPDRQSRSRDLYDNGAEMINAVMSPTFGDMTVFNSYHESRKKLDRWYIEPDGSLNPNTGDTSCEIVGPPTPAAKAMQDLRSFYSLATSLKLYTNSSTGLHVNVSVPDSLDVLKLAVFLGDQYVLASFGRENSRYAQSVLKQLQQANIKPGDFSKTKKQMDKLVKSISDDHFASINWNGKYVSFRQAGGDYLNNLQMIENTVGRFIRAMVIASDPGAYQQEYIKKLVAMAPQQPGQATQADARIAARANGIWVKERSVAFTGRISRNFDATEFLKATTENSAGRGSKASSVTANSAQAKTALLAATGLKTQTREKLTNLPVTAFFKTIIVGKNIPSQESGPGAAFGVYHNGYDRYDKIGVAVDQTRLLKPNDPDFAMALKTLTTGT